jgi:Inner membrane protein CreD
LTPVRLVAVGFIFCTSAVAWSILGGSIVQRTGESDQRLAQEVEKLWGGTHSQVAPQAFYLQPRLVKEKVEEKDAAGKTVTREVAKTVNDPVPVTLESSRVGVDLDLDVRRKGLLWYDTYGVEFRGVYRFRMAEAAAGPASVQFLFPSSQAIYDAFSFKVNGTDAPEATDLSKGLTVEAGPQADRTLAVEVRYRSRGLGEWNYASAPDGVAQVRDFQLEMTTDFQAIDFPAGTLSPTTRAAAGDGMRLAWNFESLVTGQKIGMDAPNRLNPGPLAARITFFAPVGLLFFFTVMVILGMIRGRSLHPMNYFFLAAAFFAFHLLLAYLVDHVDIHAAFAIAAATSVFLVVSYLRIVGGVRFAVLEAGIAQLVFLVLFSYAFFFEGFTGLAVTIGAVITLFVLMQMTARVDWNAVFGKESTGTSRG